MTLDPKAFKGLSRFLAPAAGGPLADRALSEKLISPEQLQECMDEQDRTGKPLDELLVERGYLKKEETERLRAPVMPPEVVEAIREPLRHVAHYVLVSLLGKGGMAEVWKAWDRSLGRWVAIKFLRPDVGHPTQRIEREGRMAGGLSHPNIISIFERGNHGGRPYLVMPVVDGTSPRAPLPPREAARIGLDVAQALAHAHGKGVIHRDVKPANIILDHAGRVNLTDFGLAIPGETASTRWAMSGTPEYASPEQVKGDVLDARTDIYSLGTTLYHFLAGRPPFRGRDPEKIADQVLSAEVEPLRDAPPSLAAAVLKAMAREPGDRYASAEDLAADLRKFLERDPLAVLKKPGSILALALAAILSVGLTYFALELNRGRAEGRAITKVLRGGERALGRAEQIRIDPDSDQAKVSKAASGAMPHFQTALRMTEGRDPRAQAGLGRCHELMGQLDPAGAAYREGRSTEEGRRGLARVYLRRLLHGRSDADWASMARSASTSAVYRAAADGAWKDVLAGGADAIEKEPYDSVLHLVFGIALLEEGKPAEARVRLARAGALSRWDPLGPYFEAKACLAEGNSAKAGALLGEALRLTPRGSPLRSKIEALRREG